MIKNKLQQWLAAIKRLKLLKYRPKLFIVVAVIVLVFGICAWLLYKITTNKSQPVVTQNKQTTPEAKPDKIMILATGDFIPHDAINLRASKEDGKYDYLQFMSAMQPLLNRANIRFCNQAVPAGGKFYGITGYPVFNSPTEVIDDMAAVGCNLINTGTNHSFDKGIKVITAELEQWDKQTNILAVAGANRNQTEANTIRYFTVQGVKFAFLSYTTYTNTPITIPYAVSMYDKAAAAKQIKAAKTDADVVIVSMRWGTEYSSAVSVYQDSIAQELADVGADIILGHGPHVLEPVKRVKASDGREAIVWFSLGNFLNAQEPIETLTSCLSTMELDIPTKKVTSLGCVPIYMHYEWTAEQKAKDDTMSRDKFLLVPLDTAKELLARSQNNTTVEAQTDRIKNLLNTYTPVKIIKSDEY